MSAFRKRFHDWGFPVRKGRLSEDDKKKILIRAKELWAENLGHKDALAIIQSEGFPDLNYRNLMTMRRDNGMKVRIVERLPFKRRRGSNDAEATQGEDGEVTEENERYDERGHSGEANGTEVPAPANVAQVLSAPAPQVSPSEQLYRAQQIQELQVPSSEKVKPRKRCRIRDVGSLPTDANGLPPCRGSLISLCESKVALELENEMYRQVREVMHNVFGDMDIDRKITAPPGMWDAAKNRICTEYPHLAEVFADPARGRGADFKTKDFAFEAIAHNVLKIMRNSDKKISVAKAGLTLGMNPLESGQLRREWYKILEKYEFTAKNKCPEDRWTQMKREWFDGSEQLLKLEREGLDHYKEMCIDRLMKDGTGRHLEILRRQNPKDSNLRHKDLPGPRPLRSATGAGLSSRKKGAPISGGDAAQLSRGGPTASAMGMSPDADFVAQFQAFDDGFDSAMPSEPGHYTGAAASSLDPQLQDSHAPPGTASQPLPYHTPAHAHSYALPNLPPSFDRGNNINNYEQDPPQAPSAAPPPPEPASIPPFSAPRTNTKSKKPATTSKKPATTSKPAQPPPEQQKPIPAYFRLSPASQQTNPSHPKLWLGKLRSRTLGALHGEATAKVSAARVGKIWGIVREKLAGGEEEEIEYVIDEAEELEIYLEEASERGKAVFVVEFKGF